MKEVRYFYVSNAADNNELPTEEATHAVRVLRLKSRGWWKKPQK